MGLANDDNYGLFLPVRHSSLRDEYLNRTRRRADDVIRQALRTQSAHYSANRCGHVHSMLPQRATKKIPNLRVAPLSPVRMPSVKIPNRYITWTPTAAYLIHDLDEPYLVYMGDSNSLRKRADDLHDRMVKDFGAVTGKEVYPQSDGEIDDTGTFKPLRPSMFSSYLATSVYDSLNAIRLRAAQRHAIFQIVTNYGLTDLIFTILSAALDLNHPRRALLLYQIACKRRAREKANRTRLEELRAHDKSIAKVLSSPSDVDDDNSEILTPHFDLSSLKDIIHNPNASRHFCRICMVFACGLHDGAQTTPRKAIPDPVRDERVFNLSKGYMKPCSAQCFLKEGVKCASELNEMTPWRADETKLLREAVSIFDIDPCSLATVLGSRSCHEVHERLADPKERQWAKTIIGVAKQPIYDSEVPKPRQTNIPGPAMLERVARKSVCTIDSYRPKMAKAQRHSATKSKHGVSCAAGATAVVEHPGCDHVGVCTQENNCPCVAKSIYCQPLCRCNGARYSYKEHTCQIETVGEECLQTADYCDCVGGKCDSKSCKCRRYNIACTPGGCKCDAYILPSQIKLRDRRCKNCDFIVGRHKRTFVGNSKIDGLGLFAGEHFSSGEVVGVYWGSHWEGDQTYMATILGEEMKRTYSFELTDKVTIDATILGSKARFANHGKTPERCNCESEIRHVRGKPYICIYTTRPVQPGEEFLFDYKLITPVGNNWLDKMN